jgi:iron complex outermembrane recepter protein
MNIKRTLRCRGWVLGTLAAGSWTVGAASAEPAAGPAQDQELQEIVVTAEKRESTVQKTPISITAISGAELQAQGTTDFQ